MALDIASLVGPLGQDAPSGPDLSFDNERQEIESAFERSISDGGGDAADIDWNATIRQIVAQAGKTRDLWLAVYLMRAGAQKGSFETLLDGAELLAGLLEQRWADVHPQLEEYEFIGRKTPCESLTKRGDFLNPLRRVVLLEHPRLGRYTGADFEAFSAQGANAPNYGMFRALIEASDAGDLQAIAARFEQLATAIRRADAVMTDNAEGDTATNFEPTYAQIETLQKAVLSQIPSSGEENPPSSQSVDAPAPEKTITIAAHSGPAFSGSIQSRDDVIRALDAIMTYYNHFEPASPVPLVLRRAKDWINLDFLAVLEDIAPNSLDEARRVLTNGRKKNAEEPGVRNDPPAPAPNVSNDGGGW